MERIIITGGTGLIGRALTRELTTHGYEVLLLSRRPAEAKDLPAGARAVAWDGRTADGWGQLADGAKAIVNLAGATIARPPWTETYKRAILESRLNGGRAVVAAVNAAANKPSVVVQASAVGIYGLRNGEPIDEGERTGDDFLAQVCRQWEASTLDVEALGVRRVIIRTGLVLSEHGGVLPLVSLPFRMFVGGPVGSGKQYWPWIHIDDEVQAIRFLIENENARGAFNLSAPTPVTNAEFSRVLARALHRPSLLPAPAFAMKLALGEMADLLLLGGQRAVPAHLQSLGYTFRYDNAERALHELLS
ncbi:MAG: TIGR01777 family oxidoreductase [Chloroflexota bacterium]